MSVSCTPWAVFYAKDYGAKNEGSSAAAMPPCTCNWKKHLSQPQPLRLPPIEDGLHNVRRQAGERQEPADVGVRDAVLLRKVGDGLRLTALDSAPPAVRNGRAWIRASLARSHVAAGSRARPGLL